MSQILVLANALAITATGPTTPVRLNVTPFNGGFGREALLHNQDAIAGGGVVVVQGHPAIAGGDTPATGSADWYTVATLNAAAPRLQEIPDLPAWIRLNTTTAGTGTATIKLEGTL